MKRFSTLALLLLASLLQAQFLEIDLEAKALKRLNENCPSGTPLTLKSVARNSDNLMGIYADIDGKQVGIRFTQLSRIEVKVDNIRAYWQDAALRHDTYREMLRRGPQYQLRQELAEEALEYLHKLESEKLLYHDLYVESYLNNLVQKMMPKPLDNWRRHNIQVKIVKDRLPHLELYPNGLFFISTGLLSALHSEAELSALVATEVAHHVLDHSVINITKAIQRARRAAFWSGVATLAAATTEVYAASQDETYVPGFLTEDVATLSADISYSINSRMGVRYPRQQQRRADREAVRFLDFLGQDTMALGSAFDHIIAYLQRMRRMDLINRPTASERLSWMERSALQGFSSNEEIGQPDANYDRLMARLHQFNATLAHYDRDWETADALFLRNMKQGFETVEAYQMMALARLYQYDDEERNREIVELTDRALKLNSEAYFLYKTKGLALFRLGVKDKAADCFSSYQTGLDLDQERLANIQSANEWERLNRFLLREYQWVNDMRYRL